jgi:hypothetical protein
MRGGEAAAITFLLTIGFVAGLLAGLLFLLPKQPPGVFRRFSAIMGSAFLGAVGAFTGGVIGSSPSDVYQPIHVIADRSSVLRGAPSDDAVLFLDVGGASSGDFDAGCFTST